MAGSARQQHHSKFDVLIRVLDAPAPGASGGATSDDLTSVFSEDDRQRWRDIVTHDSTFRTMLETAQTTEDVSSAVSQVNRDFIDKPRPSPSSKTRPQKAKEEFGLWASH